jgi:hypothetical protein
MSQAYSRPANRTRMSIRNAVLTAAVLAGSLSARGQAPPASGNPDRATVKVDWTKVDRVSKTTPTLQVVVNPPLRRGTAVHDRAFQSLRDLGCDFVRYVPWLPYPRLGVAELEPPTTTTTSWDFSLIDPMTTDFLDVTAGHSVVLNFSTIPAWMFKTDKPVTYPSDPEQAVWNYTQGTELRDPSGEEVAQYYARVVSWYTKGGFTDELGKRHDSPHHYQIAHWEVLNEPDLEHRPTPEQYTTEYDAIVGAIHRVDPAMKFVGVSVAYPAKSAEFFEYFLDPKHHRSGTPLDAISYHFYAVPALDQTPEVQQFTFFEQADKFLDIVRYIEQIRLRLSPDTKTMINEIGSISADDLRQGEPGYRFTPIPQAYWNLSGAVYAYIFLELSRIGIDVAGESQLVGFPSQFPSVSMVDWNDGRPNPRYWVLKLLHDNFGPGDSLTKTEVELPGSQGYVHAQAFVTRGGQHKLLLVNKRNRPFEIVLPGAPSRVDVVDQSTGFGPPAARAASGATLKLDGFGVAVVTWP